MLGLGRWLAALPPLLLLVGCATSEEWQTWKSHTAHFASNDHFVFSMRNADASAPRVTRREVATARDQSWWGKAITVDQQQIIER
jgi:hypothetical protein